MNDGKQFPRPAVCGLSICMRILIPPHAYIALDIFHHDPGALEIILNNFPVIFFYSIFLITNHFNILGKEIKLVFQSCMNKEQRCDFFAVWVCCASVTSVVGAFYLL